MKNNNGINNLNQSNSDRAKAENKEAKKSGAVYIVGAGPGDNTLISIKALEALKKAETIIYDNLINPSLLNEAGLDAELIYAGKSGNAHTLEQEEINKLLITKALEGKTVLRLKGGDPFLFGRGSEEAEELKKAGIKYSIIPGISSALSVPASAGIPVTDRRYSSQIHIITANTQKRSEESFKSEKPDYHALSKLDGTLVFLMSFNRLGEVAAGLINAGKPVSTPIAVISDGTTQKQKKCIATLKDISLKVKQAQLKAPAIIVVGEVVSLSSQLDNFLDEYKSLPLFNKKILLTGSRYMSLKLKKLLDEKGADTVMLSLIETVPVYYKYFYKAMEELESYTWLVFTSSNGINTFFNQITGFEEADRLKYPLDLRRLQNIKIAVIGKGSADTLKKYGFIADFIPEAYSLEALSTGLVKLLKQNDRVLILRAEEAGEAINKIFEANNISFSDIPVYKTLRDYRRKAELNRILSSCDYICLCSSLGAEAYFEMVEANKKIDANAKIISIGPVTTGTCLKYEVQPLAEASPYSAEGIAGCLCRLQDNLKK